MKLRRADPHTLAGAYALDALGDADRATFERHLGACEACRGESASLAEAVARLGTASTAAPPAHLRAAVLTEAARTRQLPPAVGGSRSRAAAWRPRGWLAAPRLALALAGSCLLIALALGALTLHMQHRLSQEQVRSHGIAAILGAPDATMMTARARHGGTVTVVMSHTDRALVLTTARLPFLPSTERYEIWLMGATGARPAGMLPVPHQGMTVPVIVSGLAAGDRVGLTAEPSAGTRFPTTPPVVMLGPLS